jgi:GT2 family glycosyltransferase
MRIAVAIPACNEADRVVACVGRLLRQSGRDPDVVVVMANNCSDRTADRLRDAFGADPRLDLREVSLPKPYAHVGWARRLAMDAAADALGGADDVLLTTDADTLVARDWIDANLRALRAGGDAVAGAAHLMRHERAQLATEHRRRLLRAGKYFTALAYLRAEQAPPHDPWPRHDYEGGASIALRLETYRAIGGAPVLRTGEDRALFDAVRAAGRRVRHAHDVRVFTSCRLRGRAEGGTADTLELWGALPAHAPAHGLTPLGPALSGKAPDRLLSFQELDRELCEAQALARARRALGLIAVGAAAPEIEPVVACAVGERD